MQPDTQATASTAAQELEILFEKVHRDTVEALETGKVDVVVVHFDQLREVVKDLDRALAELKRVVEAMSTEQIPTLFVNNHIKKTTNIVGLGRVTVNTTWSGSLLHRTRAYAWLRETGNQGLITETVNARTLGVFARAEVKAGRPLPSDIFNITTKDHVSISARGDADEE
jgi:hypothetical protein